MRMFPPHMLSVLVVVFIAILSGICDAKVACPAHDLRYLYGDRVTISKVNFLGSGCRPGTASFDVDENTQRFNIVFNQRFGLSADTRGGLVRKACNAVVKLTVAPGYRLGISLEVIKGVVVIPDHSTEGKVFAEVKTDFFYAGSHGEKVSRKFEMPMDGSFSLNDDSDTIWSSCGSSASVRLNTAMMIMGRGVMIALEEDKTALEFGMSLEECDTGASN